MSCCCLQVRDLLMYMYKLCYNVIVCLWCVVFFFFKQKTAYEMRISDWSSDVCSSDLLAERAQHLAAQDVEIVRRGRNIAHLDIVAGAELEEAFEARRA